MQILVHSFGGSNDPVEQETAVKDTRSNARAGVRLDARLDRSPVLTTFQIATLLLIALAMATSMGHALEFPGKLRLSRETYLAVQPIYYPGFTVVGGFGELIGMLGTLGLLFLTPRGSSAFWLTLGAFVAMTLMHVIFWTVTQPVNKTWLRDQSLNRASARFFGMRDEREASEPQDWTRLRNRWEYSHVCRAVLCYTALALLAVAVAAS